jgi:hypothetical protein
LSFIRSTTATHSSDNPLGKISARTCVLLARNAGRTGTSQRSNLKLRARRAARSSVRQSLCPNYRRTGLGAHTLRPLQAKIVDSMTTAFSYAISRRRQMENSRQLSGQIADEIAASYPFQPSFRTSSRSSRPEWGGPCRRPSRAVPAPKIGTAALSNLFGKSRSS